VTPADLSDADVWPAVSADADVAKAFDDCADEFDRDRVVEQGGGTRRPGAFGWVDLMGALGGAGGPGLNRAIIVPSTTAKDRNMKTTSCVGGLNFMATTTTFQRHCMFGGKRLPLNGFFIISV
jgi:hypothetical protein